MNSDPRGAFRILASGGMDPEFSSSESRAIVVGIFIVFGGYAVSDSALENWAG